MTRTYAFLLLFSLIGHKCLKVLSFAPKAGTSTAVLSPSTPFANVRSVRQSNSAVGTSTTCWFFGSSSSSSTLSDERTYPESKPATRELLKGNPFELGDAGFVRPLLKQTQLEKRKLQVVYDANRDGYNPRIFHQKVDGKGAAVVLVKAGGQWFGGYNPRGWASLGGSRPSVAAFLFYKTMFGGWEKLRVLNRGGNACSQDLQDTGIYFGADGLVIPLNGRDPRGVASSLGSYFETGPKGKQRSTLLPIAGRQVRIQELKVLVGVYAPGEDIPNSAGVTDLGFY